MVENRGYSTSDPLLVENFERFMRANHKKIIRYLLRIGAQPAEADEAAAEAFNDLLQQWRDVTHPLSWMYRVARRKFVASNARSEAQRNAESKATRMVDFRLPSAYDAFVQHEAHHQLIEDLQQLPPRQRTAVALWADQYSCAEIAMIMETEPATARSNLRHGLEKYREIRAAREQRVSAAATTSRTERRQ